MSLDAERAFFEGREFVVSGCLSPAGCYHSFSAHDSRDGYIVMSRKGKWGQS